MHRWVRDTAAGGGVAEDARRWVRELTATGRDVLRLVGTGASNAEGAAELFLGTGTVKAHLSRVPTRLGCASRVRVAIVACEVGLVAEPPTPPRR